MANLWYDNFGHATAAADVGNLYVFQPLIVTNAPAGRLGGTSAITASQARRALGATPATTFNGFAAYANVALPAESTILALRDDGTTQMSISVDLLGRVKAYRSLGGTLLGQTAVNVFMPFQWNYVDIKTTIDPAAGVVEIKVNNVVQLTLAAQNTRQSANSFINNVQLEAPGFWYARDWYVNDNSGAAPDNTYWGDINVWTRLPDGDGATLLWTRSTGAGTHASHVDENPPTGDTDYLHTAGVGDIDLWTYADVPGTGQIFAAEHRLFVRKDDAGSPTGRSICRPLAANFESADFSHGNTYGYERDPRALNPATGLQWTIAELNATQWGIKKQT